MDRRDLVLIGASAGGLDPLRVLVAGLTPAFDAAIFIVQHIGRHKSHLPELLTSAGPLPAHHATDGEPMEPGRIYVAPPDHHLLLDAGRVRLSHGPRENWTRPAIDPLFRSAARIYGARVIAVVLSGKLSDGTAGLAEVKRRGGVAIVQDPAEAIEPGMPLSALRNVAVDHRVPASAIPELLIRSSAEGVSGSREETGSMSDEAELQPPAALTCPSCGGAMRDAVIGSMPYFICHIGHRFAALNLAAAQFNELEKSMDDTLRRLNERRAFCDLMETKARQEGHSDSAERWVRARLECDRTAKMMMSFLNQGWERPEEKA